MTERYVLAAKVQYEDNGQIKTLSVTDDANVISRQDFNVTENNLVPYLVNGLVYNVAFGGIFADGDWQPRIAADIRWSESARHPYQEQANELSIGDLVLVNDDGGIDFLVTKNVVGLVTELRRGRPDQDWEDFERVFIAKNQSVRMDGRARIIISLNNVLDALFRPAFDEVFDDQTANPALRGRQKPFVIGRVKQAPLLDFDPANLTYFGADNVSKVTEVHEGGNPTENWFITDDNLIQLKASPSLDVTADISSADDEGIGASFETVFDGVPTLADFNAITESVSGSTQSVTEVSDGIELQISTTSGVFASDPKKNQNAISAAPTLSENLGVSAFDQFGERRNIWANPENIVSFGFPVNAASLTFDDDLITDDLILTFAPDFAGDVEQQKNSLLSSGFFGWPRVTVGRVSSDQSDFIKYIDFYKVTENIGDKTSLQQLNAEASFMFRFQPQSQVSTRIGFFVPEFWNYFNAEDFINQRVQIRVGIGANDGATIEVEGFIFRLGQQIKPIAQIEFKEEFTNNELIYAEVEYETTEGNPFLYVSGALNNVESEAGEFYSALKSGGYKKELNGTIKTMALVGVLPTFPVVEKNNRKLKITCLQVPEDFGPDFGSGTIKITNVKIKRAVTASTSYKDIIPYLLFTAGISPTASLDQQMINDHADALGDPDLGWLINGTESVDEVLFKLSGSLFGYVWYGLDGKVRSKMLEPPTEPTGNFLTIDEGRADPINVVTYNDIPPRLTKKVKALRNWRPIDNDRQAGIVQSWVAENRALVSRDYRITKNWIASQPLRQDFNSLYPDAVKREPYETALLDELPAQVVAQRSGNTWVQRPRFYEIDCFVRLGELELIEVGKTVKVKLDYPSLEDANLLVLGREGDSRTGFVRLTLWGFTQETFNPSDGTPVPFLGNLIVGQGNEDYNGIADNGIFFVDGMFNGEEFDLDNGGKATASSFLGGTLFTITQSGDPVEVGQTINGINLHATQIFTLIPNLNNLE